MRDRERDRAANLFLLVRSIGAVQRMRGSQFRRHIHSTLTIRILRILSPHRPHTVLENLRSLSTWPRHGKVAGGNLLSGDRWRRDGCIRGLFEDNDQRSQGAMHWCGTGRVSGTAG